MIEAQEVILMSLTDGGKSRRHVETRGVDNEEDVNLRCRDRHRPDGNACLGRITIHDSLAHTITG